MHDPWNSGRSPSAGMNSGGRPYESPAEPWPESAHGQSRGESFIDPIARGHVGGEGAGNHNAYPPQIQYIPVQPSGRRESNGIATAGMVTSAIGVFFVITVWMGFLLGLTGFILGAVGLSRSRALQGDGRGLAHAGVWLGVTAMIGSMMWGAVVLRHVNVHSSHGWGEPCEEYEEEYEYEGEYRTSGGRYAEEH